MSEADAAADTVVTEGADAGAATAAAAANAGAANANAVDVAGKGRDGATLAADPGDGRDAAATWPADWRDKLAGDDKAFRKALDRMTDPTQLGKSYRDAERKLSERAEAPKRPGKDAKPEEIAAFRKANGIPEKPEDYKFELANNRVLGDDDKPIFAEFAKRMHAANAPPELLGAAADWYLDHQQQVMDELQANDETFRTEARDTLRDEWGAEYKANLNAIAPLFDGAPETLKDRILGGRTADGRKFGDDPDTLRFLVRIAREINPAATMMPNGATSGPRGVEDRIKEIEGIMTSDPSKYWTDNNMQNELNRLYEAREKMQSRTKAA